MSISPGGQQAAASSCRIGLLPAAALGVAALSAWPPALAQAAAVRPVAQATHPQVVITATKLQDAMLTAKVKEALADDQYLFAAHVRVLTYNGKVHLLGDVSDPADLIRILLLTERAVGKRHMADQVELTVAAEDNDK